MKLRQLLGFSLKKALRQFRAGELSLLILALVLATSSTTAVDRLGGRFSLLLERQISRLVAADLAIRSSEPPSAELTRSALAAGLTVSETLSFRSMLAAGESLALAQVKAVEDGYPLRGKLQVSRRSLKDEDRNPEVSGPPQRGDIWVDRSLGMQLGVDLGNEITVGMAKLRLAAWIEAEPDRGSDFLGLAPRALVSGADVSRTSLIGPGSRVEYRLLVAGDHNKLAAWRQVATSSLLPHERFIDVAAEQGEIRRTMERAKLFLDLSTLTIVLSAGVAVALAAHRHAQREAISVAIHRTIGATRATAFAIVVLELLILSTAATMTGVGLGYVTDYLVALNFGGSALAGVAIGMGTGLAKGLGVGLITVVAFAGPSVRELLNVAPADVLKNESAGVVRPLPRLVPFTALLSALVLSPWRSGSETLIISTLLGMAGLIALLCLAGFLLIRAADQFRSHVGVGWRYGLANLARRPSSSIMQVAALGCALTVLLLLAVVERELMSTWQRRLSGETPNHFVINIQPQERQAVTDLLDEYGIAATLYPMIRGRLVAINGVAVDTGKVTEERGRRLLDREFNLSMASRPQLDNRIVAGDWWPETSTQVRQWSAERGVAEAIGFTLGDRLEFAISGRRIDAVVTSLRTVDWDSFNVNFFVVAPPGVLEGYPSTWVTSFHLDNKSHPNFGIELVKRFPSVSVIDVEAQLQVLIQLLAQVSQALSAIFLLTLVSSAVVVLASIAGTQDARRHEASVLLALGATRQQLQVIVLGEFLALGAVAGLVSGFAAGLLGVLLAAHIFGLAYWPSTELVAAAILIGTLGLGLLGIVGTREIRSTPPARALAAM